MNKLHTMLGMLLFATAINAQSIIAKNPTVITGKLVRVADPFSRPAGMKDVRARSEYGIIFKNGRVENDEYTPVARYADNHKGIDGAVQQNTASIAPSVAAATIGSNFDGLGYTSVCPADPSLCVGPSHVLQMINGGSGAYLKVWNKAGTVVVAQTYMDAITGKGGLGDPVALYDQLADRFVITEFANKPETGSEGLIVAISVTNDPAGSWKTYFFTSSTFPDYPKFSVWHDAYYCKTNDFQRNRYKGATIWAFDRAAMLSGAATATVQKFVLSTANKYYTMSPVSLSGPTPAPAGTGGLFAYMNDNTWSGSATDSVGLVECKVNFLNAANSVLINKASLATAAYSPSAPTITQPGAGQSLDALANRVMNQPQYRNFGTSESIVFSHLATTNSVAGVRWYELKKPAAWVINQQSTYQPDANHRFMSSMNINANGDIALLYNVSSSSVYPSIRVTGRRSCDPLNTMSAGETTLIAGTVASNCANRYGDYNHVVVDPTDNASFWGTAMYNKASSWSTRIGSFNLGTCPSPAVASAAVARTTASASVYPNPAKDAINVVLSKLTTNALITIMDMNGNSMMDIKTAELNNRIDVSKLLPGVYMVKITFEGKTEIHKFILE